MISAGADFYYPYNLDLKICRRNKLAMQILLPWIKYIQQFHSYSNLSDLYKYIWRTDHESGGSVQAEAGLDLPLPPTLQKFGNKIQ